MTEKSIEAISALERLAALNATMSLWAMRAGDTHGAGEFRLQASRIIAQIAEIGKSQPIQSTKP